MTSYKLGALMMVMLFCLQCGQSIEGEWTRRTTEAQWVEEEEVSVTCITTSDTYHFSEGGEYSREEDSSWEAEDRCSRDEAGSRVETSEGTYALFERDEDEMLWISLRQLKETLVTTQGGETTRREDTSISDGISSYALGSDDDGEFLILGDQLYRKVE